MGEPIDTSSRPTPRVGFTMVGSLTIVNNMDCDAQALQTDNLDGGGAATAAPSRGKFEKFL